MSQETPPQIKTAPDQMPDDQPRLSDTLVASVQHSGGVAGAVESFQHIRESVSQAAMVGGQPGIVPGIVKASIVIHGTTKELSKFGTPESHSDTGTILRGKFFDTCDSLVAATENKSGIVPKLGQRAGEKLLGLEGQQFPRLVGAWAVAKGTSGFIAKNALKANKV